MKPNVVTHARVTQVVMTRGAATHPRSRVPVRTQVAMTLLVLAALLLVARAAHAATHHASHTHSAGPRAKAPPPPAPAAEGDTIVSTHGGKVVIGPNGVHVDDADESGAHVDIGPNGISVTSGSDSGGHGRRVHVGGPVVVVDDGESGLVRVFADADVPAGQRIEGDVVAVFGSVRVKGHVSGNVAAVFGSAILDPGASVDGDVVAIGGALEQAPGAVVNGESVSLGLFSWRPGVPTLSVMLGTVLCGWLLSVLFGGLLALVFGARMRRVARTAAERTGGSLLVGIISAPLMVIAIVLLLITVIGIPLAILLPFAYVVMVWAGQVAATHVLGARLLRRNVDQGGAFGPIALGAGVVALFFALGAVLAGPPGPLRVIALFFAMLGVLLTMGLGAIGAGAMLLSRLGSREREPAPPAVVPAEPMPPPVPVAPPAV